MVSSSRVVYAIVMKCLSILGVTNVLPPPGGPIAAKMVISIMFL